MYNPSSATSISRLLQWRGPVAIIRLIVAIIFAPIDRVCHAWAWPHIGKEITKIIPPFTDPDPARPIIREVWTRWRITSKSHLKPNRVFGRARASMSPAASARLRSASEHAAKENNLFFPAIARYLPLRCTRVPFQDALYQYEFSKALPCETAMWIIRFVHDLNLLKRWFRLWVGSFGANTSFELTSIVSYLNVEPLTIDRDIYA